MSFSQATSLFRQCSSTFSRSAIRQRVAGPRVIAGQRWARYYATQNEPSQSMTEDDKKGSERQEESKAGEGSNQSASGPTTSESECEKKLKQKEQEVVDLTGRLRYLQADFLNLQRNAAREKEQTRDFAITRFAGDLLETVDVLSLALKSVPESALKSSEPSSSNEQPSDPSSTSATSSTPPKSKTAQEYLNELHVGVDMTHRLLLQTLFKYNVKPFDPTGEKFDPNCHEALYQAPIPGKEPGTVLECQKIGYTIKERTLRAAQVGVVAEVPK